jgi:two-component system alkaline phosphatase synthesis response regulator PhoP
MEKTVDREGPLNELILVIDDEPRIIKLAQDYLQSSQFRVISATDGSDGLAMARQEKPDRLIGLEIGADDYITKPFSPRELVARVRAVLRRTQGEVQGSGIIRAGGLEIDTRGHRVKKGDTSIELTRSEFDLLVALAGHPGQAFSRDQLLTRLYGTAYEGFARSIDAHIKNLRAKIEDEGSEPVYILTVYGIGYKFSDNLP